MIDPIDRQAAIDAFKKELTVGESKGNYVTICSAISYEGAKQILESLPSVGPRWIPTCEKLPEPDTDVLVTYIIDADNTVFYTAVCWHFNGVWVCEGERHFVIAWMPLPEPYREEEQDELHSSEG